VWVVKNRTSDGRASCGLGAKFKNGNWEAGIRISSYLHDFPYP
jgi:hypothetical protein